MAGNAKDYVHSKNIRLPADIYEHLVAEAEQKGIGKPSTMARMAVVERINAGRFEELINIHRRLKIFVNAQAPRISMHLTDANLALLEHAADKIVAGNFNRLVQIVLIERYKNAVKGKGGPGFVDIAETDLKSVTHNCPSCGQKRKISMPQGVASRMTTCRNCRAKYELHRDRRAILQKRQ